MTKFERKVVLSGCCDGSTGANTRSKSGLFRFGKVRLEVVEVYSEVIRLGWGKKWGFRGVFDGGEVNGLGLFNVSVFTFH